MEKPVEIIEKRRIERMTDKIDPKVIAPSL
jgi:hypothetical protein